MNYYEINYLPLITILSLFLWQRNKGKTTIYFGILSYIYLKCIFHIVGFILSTIQFSSDVAFDMEVKWFLFWNKHEWLNMAQVRPLALVWRLSSNSYFHKYCIEAMNQQGQSLIIYLRVKSWVKSNSTNVHFVFSWSTSHWVTVAFRYVGRMYLVELQTIRRFSKITEKMKGT